MDYNDPFISFMLTFIVVVLIVLTTIKVVLNRKDKKNNKDWIVVRQDLLEVHHRNLKVFRAKCSLLLPSVEEERLISTFFIRTKSYIMGDEAKKDWIRCKDYRGDYWPTYLYRKLEEIADEVRFDALKEDFDKLNK